MAGRGRRIRVSSRTAPGGQPAGGADRVRRANLAATGWAKPDCRAVALLQIHTKEVPAASLPVPQRFQVVAAIGLGIMMLMLCADVKARSTTRPSAAMIRSLL